MLKARGKVEIAEPMEDQECGGIGTSRSRIAMGMLWLSLRSWKGEPREIGRRQRTRAASKDAV